MGMWFSARQDPLPHETPAQGSEKKEVILEVIHK